MGTKQRDLDFRLTFHLYLILIPHSYIYIQSLMIGVDLVVAVGAVKWYLARDGSCYHGDSLGH